MVIRMRVSGYQGPESVHSRAVRVFEEAMTRRLGAELDFRFVMNIADRGRKVSELLPDVESGAIEMCYFSSSYLSNRVPELGIFDIPFRFRHRAQTRAALAGDVGVLLAESVARNTGFRVLAFWDNGLRHFSNGLRSINTPEDCAGLRIRTLPSAGYHETFKLLGMTPITIDVADLFSAVANGDVEAQENPLTNVYRFGLHAHHRHVTTTGHFQGVSLVLVNAKAWEQWPAHVKDAVTESVGRATSAQWGFAAEEDVEARSALIAHGVEVIDLDPAGVAAFQAAVKPLTERQDAALNPELARQLPG